MPHSFQNQAFGLRSKSFLGWVRIAFGIVLVVAAGRHLISGLKQLEGQRISFSALPLAVAAALYVGGMVSFASFWRLIVQGLGKQLGVIDSYGAYFVSQLGKYIPGKAWVLLIRCGILSRPVITRAEIVASSLYETLAVMAAGSITAVLTLSLSRSVRPVMVWMALALACGFAVVIQPWIFDKLLTIGMWPFQRFRAEPIPRVTYATLLKGSRRLILGWAMVGLSLSAVARGLGFPLANASIVFLLCGSMALSITGGFMILVVPAGLGVREWILVQTLSPVFGVGNAVLLAVASRALNILTEIVAAGGLFIVSRWHATHD